MTRFVLTRLIETMVVILIMSFVIYGLIGLMPGDPIDLMISANPHLTPADAVRLRALYGLDQPIFERYLNWLIAALQGDFGYSRTYAKPVLDILAPRLMNSLLLMGVSFALSVAIALPHKSARGPFKKSTRWRQQPLWSKPHGVWTTPTRWSQM